MSKPDRLDNYPLFFEEIGPGSRRPSADDPEPDRHKAATGLSEEQISRLSDDLQTPMNPPSTKTNPIQ